MAHNHWEKIEWPGINNYYRVAVPGGWIVEAMDGKTDIGTCMTFVPDPAHTWDPTWDYRQEKDPVPGPEPATSTPVEDPGMSDYLRKMLSAAIYTIKYKTNSVKFRDIVMDGRFMSDFEIEAELKRMINPENFNNE